MRGILAPLLRQAGHDVQIGIDIEQQPDVILCSGDAAICGTDDVPVLILSDSADVSRSTEGLFYRYDRDRIMTAIADLAGKRAA